MRTATPELEELGASVIDGVDVASDDAIARISAGIGSEPIDVVLANAGVNHSFAADIEQLDLDVLQQEFAINTFGVVRTVKAVLPNLHEGSKIAVISTWRPGVGAASRNYGYQMSKVATNQLAFLLAESCGARHLDAPAQPRPDGHRAAARGRRRRPRESQARSGAGRRSTSHATSSA